MKSIFFQLLVLLLLTSCRPVYQFYSVSSDELPKENSYFFENDTLRIEYAFNGQNIPIHLTIQNKLREPIMINWAESAAVVNGSTQPYFTNSSQINATIHGTSNYYDQDISNFSGNLSGIISSQPHITFLPPQSSINRNNITRMNRSFLYPSPTEQPSSISTEEAYRDVPFAFKKEESPLVFNSYLTILFPKSQLESKAFHHSFYVSALNYTHKKAPNPTDPNESLRIVDHESGPGVGIFFFTVFSGLLLLLVL
jgi:hypothetical protein